MMTDNEVYLHRQLRRAEAEIERLRTASSALGMLCGALTFLLLIIWGLYLFPIG